MRRDRCLLAGVCCVVLAASSLAQASIINPTTPGVDVIFDTIGADFSGLEGTALPNSNVTPSQDQFVGFNAPGQSSSYALNWTRVAAAVGQNVDFSVSNMEVRVYFGMPWDRVTPDISVMASLAGTTPVDTGINTGFFGDDIMYFDLLFPEIVVPANQEIYIGWVAHLPTEGSGVWMQAVESDYIQLISGFGSGVGWNIGNGNQRIFDQNGDAFHEGIVAGMWGYIPAPATAALFVLAGLGANRRRR